MQFDLSDEGLRSAGNNDESMISKSFQKSMPDNGLKNLTRFSSIACVCNRSGVSNFAGLGIAFTALTDHSIYLYIVTENSNN